VRPWGAPLERFDGAWQRLEGRLCAAILTTEIASLTLWVALKVLSGAGLHWASNLLNWLQNASVLMLVGGLRGLVTRLTLWVALVGASLATSRGKHIHVDVLVRYIPARGRSAAAVVSWLAAAIMCVAAVAGFVDHIAIAQFRAPAVRPCAPGGTATCDTPAGEKLATVARAASADLFLLGRQTALDARSLPRVVVGIPYDQWMTAEQWNAWLDGAAWVAHFDRAAVDAIHMDPAAPDAKRMPQVVVPGTGEEARGLLARELNFVFPFGLAVIALKFLLRALLVLAGRVEEEVPG
jgi:TRAP-type C4-dicarboxylate transport system permease small subunit